MKEFLDARLTWIEHLREVDLNTIVSSPSYSDLYTQTKETMISLFYLHTS